MHLALTIARTPPLLSCPACVPQLPVFPVALHILPSRLVSPGVVANEEKLAAVDLPPGVQPVMCSDSAPHIHCISQGGFGAFSML